MRNRNSLLYQTISIIFFLLLYNAQTYAQSCFPSGCNIRIKFTGGIVNGNNKIQICQGDSTLLTIDTSACSGANFSGLSYKWQFKNNGGWSDFQINPNRNNDSIYVKNDFQYRLIITGSSCSNTIEQFFSNGNTYPVDVVFASNPDVQISATSTSVCSNSTTGVTLTASGASTYIWSPTGGLNPTTGASVNARPSSTTTYTVTGTSAAGCKASDQIQINVVNPPNVDFTTNIGSNGCISNREVKFNPSCSSGNCNNLSYQWNFGDPGSGSDNTSTNNDPSHKFTNANQSYTVNLIVTNGAGCKDTVTKTISIGAVPDATITDPINFLTPFKICGSGSFQLAVVNSSQTKATNTNYRIEWGDGTIYTGPTFGTNDTLTHTYPDFGFYDLKFIVTAGSGCTSTSTEKVFIGSNPAVGLTSPGSTIGLCVPLTRTFLIDTATTNQNPPGTIYTVSYNDGSPNDVFTHPAPATFTHTFNKSSCGATGGRTQNTFFVSIRAENPCGFNDATVEPITTVTKPDANFTISPSPTVCLGTTVRFTDATINGIFVDNSGNCIRNYLLFWSITPNVAGANFTVTGNLGTFPNATGINQISAVFNTAGTYDIRLIIRTNVASSNLCNLDTVIKTICVQAPPVANFVATPLKGCSPFTITTVNNSVFNNVCGSIRNRWIITKTGGDCIQDSTRNYSYVSPTDSTSFEPVIRLNNQGTYNIRLGLSNACPEVFSPTQTFTVIRKPEVVLTAPNAVCTGTTINPSVTVKNCLDTLPERHFWTFQGATPSSANTDNPGTINFPANTGTTPVSYLIKDSVVNGCGSTVVQKSITINPLPTITGTLTVCVGRTTQLSGSGSPASTNAWSSSNTTIATVGNTGLVTGRAAGQADITYTDNNGCRTSVTITVYPNPTVSVVASATSICSGQGSATLTASGADNYTWTSNPAGFTSNSNPIAVSPTAQTTYIATGSFSSTGCSAQGQVTISVNPIPTITGQNNVCVGRTLQLRGNFTPSPSTPWTSSNPAVATVSNTGIVTGVSVGTTEIIYTTNNNCRAILTVTVNPNPIVSINASTTTICAGQGSATLTASGADTYSWTSSPIGFTSNSNPVTVSPTAQTTYTATGSFSSTGCSAQGQVTISTNPLPTITGQNNVCVGRNIQLTGTLPAATTIAWTSSNVAIATVDNSGLVTGVAPGNVIITYTNTNDCRNNFNVVVNPIPNISGSKSDPTACRALNGSITITGLLSTARYVLSYNKGGVAQPTININNPASGSYILTGLSSGTYDIVVTSNGCPSNTLTFSLVDPNAPDAPIASYSGPVCSGNNLTLTATTNVTGTLTWNWSGPNGFSRTVQNPTITNAQVTASGPYNVTLTLNNCTSAAGTVNVVVYQTPVLPVVSNNGPLCTDSTLKLFASTTSTMPVSWSWTGPNGFTSVLQNPTISSATSAMSGIYRATVTASYTSPDLTCSSSATTTVQIRVSPTINATGTNPTTCGGTNGSITITGMTSGTYQLRYLRNGVLVGPINITVNSTGQHIISNLPAGTYDQIEVTLNGCPSNKVGPIVLLSPTSPDLTIPSSNIVVCEGQPTGNITFTSNPSSATINWSNSNTLIGLGLSSTGSINSFIAANTTAVQQVATITITASISGCVSAPQTMTITVNPRPKIANITQVICSEGSFSVTPSSSVSGNIIPQNTTYTWTVADNPSVTGESENSTGVGSISDTLTNTSNSPQEVVYTVTPKSGVAGNCDGLPFTIRVTVNPKPQIQDTTLTICSNGTYDFIPPNTSTNIVPNNSTYSWSAFTFSSPGAITVLNGASATDVLRIAGKLKNNTTDQQWAEFIVTPKGNPGACPGNSFKVRIFVNPGPMIDPISDTICSEGSFRVTPSSLVSNNVIPSNTTYTWTVQDNPNVTGEENQPNQQTLISDTLINITNVSQQVLYSVTPVSGAVGNCPGQPFTLTIIVAPKPQILDTVLTICSGTPFKYSPINTPPSMLAPAGTTYTWGDPLVTGGLVGGAAGTSTDSITGTLSNTTTAVQTATYTVTPKSGNCTGPDFKIIVRVNPAPTVIFSPGDQKICSGDNTLEVNLSSTSSNVSIPWQATPQAGITGIVASGFDKIPVQTLINNTPNPITVTYTATARTTGSAICNGTPSLYKIVVNPRPKIANITQAICSDSFFTVTPSVNVSGNIIPDGTTYTWSLPSITLPGTVTGTRAGNAQAFITDTLRNLTNQPQTVTYTIVPTSGIADSCKGNPFTITVTVNPTPVIPTLYDTICTGETFQLTPQNGNPNADVIVPNNTRYSWSAPSARPGIGGLVSGINQSAITGVLTNTNFVPETIEYIVTPVSGIAGSCQGKPFKVFVTVNPLSSISNNPRFQAVCNDGTTSEVTWTSFTPNSSFAWTLVSSGGITGFAPSGNGPKLSAMTLKNVGVDVDSLVYSVTSTASACAAPATLYKIYVYPDAKATFDAPIDTACWPFNIPIRNTSPVTANGDYKWYANGNLIGNGTNFPGYTIQGPNDSITIKMVAISKYGCRADSTSKKYYTYKQPDASFTSSIDRACGPLSVYFTNTSTFNSTFKYEWDFGNGRTSTQYQPDSIYYITNPNFGDTVYNVTLKAFNQCDTLRFTKQIIVQSKPLSRFLPNKTTGCSPLTVVYNNSSLGVGNTYIWDFGDGSPTVTTNIKDNTTHTYFVGVKTTFIVKLIAINPCGSDTSFFNLVVTPNPIKLDFAVLGTEQNGCAPLTVSFFNKTSGAQIFRWDFGDGNILSTTKNVDTIIHTFLNPGKYTVKLNATSICSDTSSTEIIDVFGKPTPKFIASSLSKCIGDSIKFTNQTTGDASGYLWNFGDGSTSVLVNPGHKYARAGLYTVTLIAFKDHAPGVTCLDSFKIQVNIIDTLPINFGISATLGKCRPFKVTLTNTFLNYRSLEWDFGDGTKATGDVVEHTYTQNGIYNVRLTIVDEGGCTYTAVKQITIAAPDGTVRVQTGFNCQDDNVRFEAVPVNTDLISWNFGDGKTLTTTNRVVFHKYLNPGTYFASAEFVTNEGCRYIVPGTYEIKVDRIVPGFKYVQAEECGSTKVRFTDTSNVFFGKSSIEWNFGDGKKGTGTEITHSFTASGTYVVQQIIKSNSGCSDTIQTPVQVIVRSFPNADFINDPVICTNTDVRFASVVTSTDPVNFYKWNFSNGINSDKDALIARFATAGNVTVQFITGTIYACNDTIQKTLKINQTPTVRAAPEATICKGQSVNLIASGALNYTWSPIDYLSNPNIANPVAKPDVTTPYTVKGTTADGCFAYDTINIIVLQPFKITVMPGDSICVGQSLRLLASGAYRYEWTPAATLNQSNIPNPLATPPATTNYRVVGFDEYGCFNDTGYVLVGVGLYPVVDLGPDLTLSTGTLQKLTSTITNGPIQQWLWSPPVNLNCTTCPEPTALINNDIEYKLKVTNFFGCSGEDAVRIKVFCEDSQVYIPNAFSPDGDGRNDVFMVRGKGIMQVKSMRVFNRWGDLVFEKTNIKPNDPTQGWDGLVRGVATGPDVFAYIVEVVCDNGIPYFYKGNVTLLK